MHCYGCCIMHCYGLPQHALGGGRNKRGVHLVLLYFRAATANPMMLGKQFPMLTSIDMEDYRFS